jgi:outer membrane protein OmpA-like peptidoglycan-associated protein
VTNRPLAVALVATFAGTLEMACANKHVTPAPAAAPGPSSQTLVVLLPDSDTGTTGRAFLTNNAGTTDLNTARDSATASTGQRPAAVTTMSEDEVQRLFGDALSALPPPPVHFTLYFKFESDELTDESRALLPQILNTVKQRAIPEVLVIGHTDTMGAPRANFDLGMHRATAVFRILIQVGFDPDTIEIRSHGESDPMVKTPDETPEARNRRVEISVR